MTMEQGTALSGVEPTGSRGVDRAQLKAPRGWIWDFLLHFSTFGLYTCFWMVARLREFRYLGQGKVRPWLWFFVPILVFAQLFALPRLVRYLGRLEASYGVNPWRAGRYLWILAVVAVTIFFNVQQSVAVPAWATFPALIVWAFLFTFFESRLNAVKRRMTPTYLRKQKRGYSLLEWFIVIPMLPASFGLIGYTSFGSLGLYDQASLTRGQVYEDPEGRFQFPITTNGWTQVKAGTFADSESELELRGPVDNLFAIVFHYDNLSLDELAFDRRATFYQGISLADCTESRRFAKGDLTVVANIVCEGRQMGDPALWASSIIETDTGLYELVTQMSVPRLTFRRLEANVLKMTGGFEPR